MIWEEQGVGDKIIFGSRFPDLIERGVGTLIECDKRLIPLFSRSFPAITVAASDDPDIGKTEDKTFDVQAAPGNNWSLAARGCGVLSRPPVLSSRR
jgi:hypothetical protein